MKSTETVSLAQLRRYVVAEQGFAKRFRRSGAAEVEATIRRLSAVQLDSITTVERSHRIALGSRIGAYPQGTVSELLRSGRVFEYWAHEASLVPIEDFPHFKHRMVRLRVHRWFGPVLDSEPKLAKWVLAEIRERGPLASRQLGGKGGGGMWNWKPEKMMLEALFATGELVVAGRAGFQRLYELPERIIPDTFLGAPVPDEAAWVRGCVLRAVRARGALTEYGICDHYRIGGGVKRIRPYVESLVAEGRLRRLAPDDGGAPVYVPAEAEPDGAVPRGGVLLSPFDNLLWDRPFTERLFGFRHVIEVYKREHERQYGYYVLPFLLGDRLVGRVDLKADRREGVLRVRAFHLEPGVRRSARLESALERALARLARTIGLAQVVR